jgi:hypothetical protein
MANIILSAKSGSDWTDNELTAFNIQVDSVDAATFFNMAQLPDPLVSNTILTSESRPQGALAKRDRLFFQYMKDAVKGEESLVDDFAAFLLGMFEYDEPEGVIHQRKELSFVMCGTSVDAKPDVCVMAESQYLLLVQEDKVRPSFPSNLIACLMRSCSAVLTARILSHSSSPKLLRPSIKIIYDENWPAGLW